MWNPAAAGAPPPTANPSVQAAPTTQFWPQWQAAVQYYQAASAVSPEAAVTNEASSGGDPVVWMEKAAQWAKQKKDEEDVMLQQQLQQLLQQQQQLQQLQQQHQHMLEQQMQSLSQPVVAAQQPVQQVSEPVQQLLQWSPQQPYETAHQSLIQPQSILQTIRSSGGNQQSALPHASSQQQWSSHQRSHDTGDYEQHGWHDRYPGDTAGADPYQQDYPSSQERRHFESTPDKYPVPVDSLQEPPRSDSPRGHVNSSSGHGIGYQCRSSPADHSAQGRGSVPSRGNWRGRGDDLSLHHPGKSWGPRAHHSSHGGGHSRPPTGYYGNLEADERRAADEDFRSNRSLLDKPNQARYLLDTPDTGRVNAQQPERPHRLAERNFDSPQHLSSHASFEQQSNVTRTPHGEQLPSGSDKAAIPGNQQPFVHPLLARAKQKKLEEEAKMSSKQLPQHEESSQVAFVHPLLARPNAAVSEVKPEPGTAPSFTPRQVRVNQPPAIKTDLDSVDAHLYHSFEVKDEKVDKEGSWKPVVSSQDDNTKGQAVTGKREKETQIPGLELTCRKSATPDESVPGQHSSQDDVPQVVNTVEVISEPFQESVDQKGKVEGYGETKSRTQLPMIVETKGEYSFSSRPPEGKEKLVEEESEGTSKEQRKKQYKRHVSGKELLLGKWERVSSQKSVQSQSYTTQKESPHDNHPQIPVAEDSLNGKPTQEQEVFTSRNPPDVDRLQQTPANQQTRGTDFPHDDRPPPERDFPPDCRPLLERDFPPDRGPPPERDFQPDRRLPPERGFPLDHRPPPERDFPPDRRLPPERDFPPDRRPPPERDFPPNRRPPLERDFPPDRRPPPGRHFTPDHRPPERDYIADRRPYPGRDFPPDHRPPEYRRLPERDIPPGRRPPGWDYPPNRRPLDRDIPPGRRPPDWDYPLDRRPPPHERDPFHDRRPPERDFPFERMPPRDFPPGRRPPERDYLPDRRLPPERDYPPDQRPPERDFPPADRGPPNREFPPDERRPRDWNVSAFDRLDYDPRDAGRQRQPPLPHDHRPADYRQSRSPPRGHMPTEPGGRPNDMSSSQEWPRRHERDGQLHHQWSPGRDRPPHGHHGQSPLPEWHSDQSPYQVKRDEQVCHDGMYDTTMPLMSESHDTQDSRDAPLASDAAGSVQEAVAHLAEQMKSIKGLAAKLNLPHSPKTAEDWQEVAKMVAAAASAGSNQQGGHGEDDTQKRVAALLANDSDSDSEKPAEENKRSPAREFDGTYAIPPEFRKSGEDCFSGHGSVDYGHGGHRLSPRSPPRYDHPRNDPYYHDQLPSWAGREPEHFLPPSHHGPHHRPMSPPPPQRPLLPPDYRRFPPLHRRPPPPPGDWYDGRPRTPPFPQYGPPLPHDIPSSLLDEMTSDQQLLLAAAVNSGSDSKKKGLPTWLKEGLEKLEKEKQRKAEQESSQKRKKNRWSDVTSGDEDPSKTTTYQQDSYAAGSRSTLKSELDEELQVALVANVRRLLTEILLSVTNSEISAIVREAMEEEETKFKFKIPALPKRALKKISLLGLSQYGSDSSSGGSGDEREDKGKWVPLPELPNKPAPGMSVKQIAAAFAAGKSKDDSSKKKKRVSRWSPDVSSKKSRSSSSSSKHSYSKSKSSKSHYKH